MCEIRIGANSRNDQEGAQRFESMFPNVNHSSIHMKFETPPNLDMTMKDSSLPKEFFQSAARQHSYEIHIGAKRRNEQEDTQQHRISR